MWIHSEICNLKIVGRINKITKTNLKQNEYAISTTEGLYMIQVIYNNITLTNESYFIHDDIIGSIELNK
jgi:hypothetical protein